VRIDSGFAIERPPDEAYALLLDLERVTPCFPGAELGADDGNGAREVTVTVRLGPMRLVYDGAVRIAERDDPARRAVLSGDARDRRGGGAASASIAMRVSPDGAGSRVEAVAELELSGRAASLGQGIVEDVAHRLVDDMAACLADRFAALPADGPDAGPGDGEAAEAAPLRAGGLLWNVLWARLKALFRRRG
jgi:carbon monoxide dehydrogenase subunit G